ncbi:hypothetical protein DICPUDRAFT_92631 [Dictyostelium purpureum]|uniref:Inorganic phosphate transporter n=1 Tax=Dictyostelium purpureum TaxID=5786 RepID=F0ZUV9_DICPU|nr:uncharacterized protein DICPUDRAFT_92631 [Dictyostelium purpureum]EGC32272.1 hypothetical protein DICPUDRAFT_92631 [Dictyostelium purpureum]|eukprot:XP_003291209.1 hypothetical protein DICPUDRAFT_92631 [Dictyostelium purpureum]
MFSNKMTDMAITFGSLFLIQKIDFTNPQNVFYAQCAFGVIQATILLAYLYIFNSIKSKPNNTVVRVPVNPPSMFSKPDPNEPTSEQTASEYDLAQLKKSVTQSLVTIGITAFLFFKMGIIQPIAMQSIMAPQNFIKNKLFKIYVLGQDESNFKRPWTEESPFSMGQNETTNTTTENTDNITIAASKEDAKEKTIAAVKGNTTKRSTVPSKAKVTEISSSEGESSEEDDNKKKTKKKYL